MFDGVSVDSVGFEVAEGRAQHLVARESLFRVYGGDGGSVPLLLQLHSVPVSRAPRVPD